MKLFTTILTILTINIKILVWNCRGFKNKNTELIKKSKKYDILVLIETNYHNINEMYFSDNKTYFKESRGNSEGAAIIVKNYIEFDVITA